MSASDKAGSNKPIKSIEREGETEKALLDLILIKSFDRSEVILQSLINSILIASWQAFLRIIVLKTNCMRISARCLSILSGHENYIKQADTPLKDLACG